MPINPFNLSFSVLKLPKFYTFFPCTRWKPKIPVLCCLHSTGFPLKRLYKSAGTKVMGCRNVPSATKQSEIDLKLRLSFEFPLSCIVFREIASVTLATKWRVVNRCNIKCNSGTCLI